MSSGSISSRRRPWGLRAALAPWALAAGLLCLLAVPAAHADALLDAARVRLAAADAAGAYQLLESQELARAGEPDFDYLLGIAALDAGHVTRAILALERVLACQPGNNLARAEIGRAYLLAGERDAARTAFEQARQAPMPAAAAATIDRLLTTLAERPEGGLTRAVRRAHVAFSLGHDSNVNSASAAAEVAIPAFGGLVFTLDPETRGHGAHFAALELGADAQWPLAGAFSAIAAATVKQSWPQQAHAYAQQNADAHAGLAWEHEGDRVAGALQAGSFHLGGQRYREATGLSLQWQHTLAPATQLSGFGEWSQLHYPGQQQRNADRTLLGVGAARALAGGRSVPFGSVYAVQERSREGMPEFGHRGAGARAGLEQALGARWSGYASVQYELRRYSGPAALFGLRRRDHQADLVAGLRWRFAADWQLLPQLGLTRNASNLPLAGYRRNVFQLSLRRDFE